MSGTAHDQAQRSAGDERRPADPVHALTAASEQLLQRSRQRATAAMAHVRRVERLLHPTAVRPAVAGADGGTRSNGVAQLVEQELAAHLRAVELHEVAAQLQEELGWPARAVAARAHAARARELSRRARQELARLQALAAAAQQRVHEAHRRLS